MKVIDVTSQFKMNYLSSSVGLEVALICILDFFKFLIKQKINLHVYKENRKIEREFLFFYFRQIKVDIP